KLLSTGFRFAHTISRLRQVPGVGEGAIGLTILPGHGRPLIISRFPCFVRIERIHCLERLQRVRSEIFLIYDPVWTNHERFNASDTMLSRGGNECESTNHRSVY